MAKKKDSFYFDNFIDCAKTAHRASKRLSAYMEAYEPAKVADELAAMHALENTGDERNHEVADALVSAFITPIEREDIALLSERLDAVIDHIEGVLHRIYFCNIQEMRPSAVKMAAKLVEGCASMIELVEELPRFKRSKVLKKHVIRINDIENDCDDLYIESMRELHTTERDPLQVIAWRDVYTFLEITADSIEDVAETVQNIVMKNS